MVIAILVVTGLCFGSFVNALVWRLHEQEETTKHKVAYAVEKKLRSLSILKGRSMCPECRHELAAKDLVPLLSWLWLRGKCRYCHKHISWQYPIVEAATTVLFVMSYLWWPQTVTGVQWVSLVLWLAILVGLVALTVYDLRWRLLPNKIVFVLLGVAAVRAIVLIAADKHPWVQLGLTVLGVLVGGGIFYVLFQLSKGTWIGGGDVKLGFLLGLTVAQPAQAFLLIFFAALLGTLAVLPPLFQKKITKATHIPFGPFLIAGCVIVLLWGASILAWYQNTFINLSGR